MSYNAQCRKCGSDAYQGIGPVKCSNSGCEDAEHPREVRKSIIVPMAFYAHRRQVVVPNTLTPRLDAFAAALKQAAPAFVAASYNAIPSGIPSGITKLELARDGLWPGDLRMLYSDSRRSGKTMMTHAALERLRQLDPVVDAVMKDRIDRVGRQFPLISRISTEYEPHLRLHYDPDSWSAELAANTCAGVALGGKPIFGYDDPHGEGDDE